MKQSAAMKEFLAQAKLVNEESKAGLIHIFRDSDTVDIELVHMLIAFAALKTGKTFSSVRVRDLLASVNQGAAQR